MPCCPAMLLMSIVYVMCIIMQFSRFLWQINDDDNDYDGVLYQYYDLFIKMKEPLGIIYYDCHLSIFVFS